MALTSSPAFSTAITLLKAHLQSSNEPITSSHSFSTLSSKPLVPSSIRNTNCNLFSVENAVSLKWRTRVSFFSGFFTKGTDVKSLKDELFDAISPLDRGAEPTPEDQERVDQVCEPWFGLFP